MDFIRTIRRYLRGKLNSRRTKGDGDDFGIAFGTVDLFLSLRSLQVATNFFSDRNEIRRGAFGRLYKGLLPNGQEIAVKKLSSNSIERVMEFRNEVKLLSEMRHMNLVTLLGCCAEGPEKLVVYEYLPNKSLDYFLFDKEKSSSLDWATRFRIARGVARGILYLHEEAPLTIIHRDITASNILLDDRMSPKISDFGLASLSLVEDTLVKLPTRISGTHSCSGYMAPEYAMYGSLSVKTDVYSYGILLLELISGRKNFDHGLSTEYADLANYAWTLYKAGKTLELADPNLGDHYNRDEVDLCIQIGLMCCQRTDTDRPDMNLVYLILSNDSLNLPVPGKPEGRWTSMKSSVGRGSAGNNIDIIEDHS